MDRLRPPFYLPILFTIATVIVAFLLGPARILSALKTRTQRLVEVTIRTSPTTTVPSNMGTKTPVYFLSHGGPNIMFDTEHPVYPELQKIGREITTVVKPKGVVVFSAHWQGSGDVIEVNTAEKTDLVYDYYGFPPHYYKVQYPNRGSPSLAATTLALLTAASIKTHPTTRGLDHGIFAVSKVCFPETHPLSVPIVQVSLFASPDPDLHYRLGQAVAPLRDHGILILVSGMAVHNLRDMRVAMASDEPMPYAVSFDEALREAVESEPGARQARMAALLEREDARRAHPTLEHLLPLFVGAGAAGGDWGRRTWTMAEGSFSWAQYRFGDVTGA